MTHRSRRKHGTGLTFDVRGTTHMQTGKALVQLLIPHFQRAKGTQMFEICRVRLKRRRSIRSVGLQQSAHGRGEGMGRSCRSDAAIRTPPARPITRRHAHCVGFPNAFCSCRSRWAVGGGRWAVGGGRWAWVVGRLGTLPVCRATDPKFDTCDIPRSFVREHFS